MKTPDDDPAAVQPCNPKNKNAPDADSMTTLARRCRARISNLERECNRLELGYRAEKQDHTAGTERLDQELQAMHRTFAKQEYCLRAQHAKQLALIKTTIEQLIQEEGRVVSKAERLGALERRLNTDVLVKSRVRELGDELESLKAVRQQESSQNQMTLAGMQDTMEKEMEALQAEMSVTGQELMAKEQKLEQLEKVHIGEIDLLRAGCAKERQEMEDVASNIAAEKGMLLIKIHDLQDSFATMKERERSAMAKFEKDRAEFQASCDDKLSSAKQEHLERTLFLETELSAERGTLNTLEKEMQDLNEEYDREVSFLESQYNCITSRSSTYMDDRESKFAKLDDEAASSLDITLIETDAQNPSLDVTISDWRDAPEPPMLSAPLAQISEEVVLMEKLEASNTQLEKELAILNTRTDERLPKQSGGISWEEKLKNELALKGRLLAEENEKLRLVANSLRKRHVLATLKNKIEPASVALKPATNGTKKDPKGDKTTKKAPVKKANGPKESSKDSQEIQQLQKNIEMRKSMKEHEIKELELELQALQTEFQEEQLKIEAERAERERHLTSLREEMMKEKQKLLVRRNCDDHGRSQGDRFPANDQVGQAESGKPPPKTREKDEDTCFLSNMQRFADDTRNGQADSSVGNWSEISKKLDQMKMRRQNCCNDE